MIVDNKAINGQSEAFRALHWKVFIDSMQRWVPAVNGLANVKAVALGSRGLPDETRF